MTATACHNCERPTHDGSPICTTCLTSLRTDLLHVPGLIADMTITRGRLDRVSNNRNGGKSSESPLPIREHIDRKTKHGEVQPIVRPLDALVTEIGLAARLVAEHANIDLVDVLDSPGLHQLAVNLRGGRVDPDLPPRTDPTALTLEAILDVEQAAVWLAHNPTLIAGFPAVDELFDDLTDVLASARRAIDRLPELVYKGTCDYTWTDDRGEIRCCGADLYVDKGAQFVRCGACRSHYDVRALDKKILAQMHEMLYTTNEVATLLRALGHRVPKGTVWSWASRREMEPRGWKHHGRITDHWIHANDPAVYRLGDALALVEDRHKAGASA